MKEVAASVEDTDDVNVSKDGTLVLDLLEAIHAAEKRQADIDARIFSQEKRLMKARLFFLISLNCMLCLNLLLKFQFISCSVLKIETVFQHFRRNMKRN